MEKEDNEIKQAWSRGDFASPCYRPKGSTSML